MVVVLGAQSCSGRSPVRACSARSPSDRLLQQRHHRQGVVLLAIVIRSARRPVRPARPRLSQGEEPKSVWKTALNCRLQRRCLAILLVPLVVDDLPAQQIFPLLIFGVAIALNVRFAVGLKPRPAMTFAQFPRMAMFLKLKTVPIHTGSDGLTSWSGTTPPNCPGYGGRSIRCRRAAAGILVPALFAALLGWFMFGRVAASMRPSSRSPQWWWSTIIDQQSYGRLQRHHRSAVDISDARRHSPPPTTSSPSA